MTYSVPVIELARGDVRNAIRSATSRGLAGRSIGIPPSEAALRVPSRLAMPTKAGEGPVLTLQHL